MATRLSLPASFHTHFGPLPDPRVKRTRRYPLIHLLFMAFCAVLCGAEGWEDIELFAEERRRFFRRFFRLRRGSPSADTFRRVFERLQPKLFAEAFTAWANELATVMAKHLAIDGKSLRGVVDSVHKTSPLHLLHVWASDQRLLLGMVRVNGAPGETMGIKQMLDLLKIAGSVITLDANGCTQEIAGKIIGGEGDYILALKGNRGPIYAAVVKHWKQRQANGFAGTRVHRSRCQGHGRLERRVVHVCRADFLPEEMRAKWAGLQSVARVERTRIVGDHTSTEEHFYLLSLAPEPKRASELIRRHWSVENELHWSLDVGMGEDGSRVKTPASAHNLAVLRRMAINTLKHPKAGKESLKRKQKRAMMSDRALLRLLSHGPHPEPKEAA
ncbi:MAG: ISAs1 family transposase [Myxococcaceae bacterium]|nr:MAG: ISAs1 family transposase [Myxococcaceae bacterium]